MEYLMLFYGLFLVAYVGYSAVGIYHLWRFGYVGDATRPVIIIYSTLSVLIVVLSLVLIFIRYINAPVPTEAIL